MQTQLDYATTFTDLHKKGDPLILFNIWDVGTAKAVEETEAQAIATSSLSVAVAHGFQDGEQLPLDLVIGNIQRIVEAVDLPVTVDIECGYGQSIEALEQTITRVIKAGAIGINFEDQIIGENSLYSIKEQSKRITAIRQIANTMKIPIFINARTDIFLQLNGAEPQQEHLEQAIDRASAYSQAGASGFFVPGLHNSDVIATLCETLEMPVNTMFSGNGLTTLQMAELGVSRISYGPHPYFKMLNTLKEQALGSVQWRDK